MSNNVATFEEQQSIIIISGYIRFIIDLSASTIVPQDIIRLCYLFYKFTKFILCFEHSDGYNCIEMDALSNINLQVPVSTSKQTTKCMANEIQWKYPSIIYWDQLKYTSYSGIFEFNKAHGQSSILLFETNHFQRLMHDKNTTKAESFHIYLPRLPSESCDECVFDKEYGVIAFSDAPLPQIYQLNETDSKLDWTKITFYMESSTIKWCALSKMVMVDDSLFITNAKNSVFYNFISNQWTVTKRSSDHQRSFNVCHNYRKSRVYCIYENCDIVIYEYMNDFWRKHSRLSDIRIIGDQRAFHYDQSSKFWMNQDSDSILYYMDHMDRNEKQTVYFVDEREDKYRWKKHDRISSALITANVNKCSAVFT